MLSIGEFSRITNLTVKSLRYYHDMEILIPEKVDRINGYRYYGENSLNRADQISILKSLGFTINEIRAIYDQCTSEDELSMFINEKIQNVDKQIKDLKKLKKQLKYFNSADDISEDEYKEIREDKWGGFWYCSLRFHGKYEEIGNKYRKLYKNCGSSISGKSMAFYYDMEYKEENADIEALIPVNRELKLKDMNCQYFENSLSVSILHKGPYGSQGKSYGKLFKYCDEKRYEIQTPIIEKYIKGPGILFKGNDEKYLTEIRFLIN